MSHFFLFATELTFVDTTGEGGVTRLNTLVQSETRNLKARQIAKVQMSAQVQLRERLNDMNLSVLNVVILNINYIGEMSMEEFHDGMAELAEDNQAAQAVEPEAPAPVTAFDIDPAPLTNGETANELSNDNEEPPIVEPEVMAADAVDADAPAVQEAEPVENIEDKPAE